MKTCNNDPQSPEGENTCNHSPAITAQPANVALREGRQAVFSVGASGPGLSYYWKRNGSFIPGATTALYATNSLHVADSGAQFSCLVSNSYATTNSQAATLTVLPARPLIGSLYYGNGVCSFAWAALPGEAFLVQYKTNLLQADWLNLGGPFLTTNSTLSVSDSVTGSRRFYRVVLP